MDLKCILSFTIALCSLANLRSAELPVLTHFRENIRPILSQYCFDCHADGMNKGGVAFDEFKSDAVLLTNNDLWLAVLKNVRSGLMPPSKKPRPSPRKNKSDWKIGSNSKPLESIRTILIPDLSRFADSTGSSTAM